MYLGVLHTEHWQVGLLFLEAGKNVLCEKPFAMNSRQVKDLVAAAKKNNVFLMEVSLEGCSRVDLCLGDRSLAVWGHCRHSLVLTQK